MADRYVLIGSGPGSMSAAQSIRSRNEHAEIVMVCAERDGYYSRPGLAYYLDNEVPDKYLFPFAPEEIAHSRVEWLFGRATRLDPAGHVVTLDDGRTLSYDRLLLATGATSIPLHVPGAELDGVVKLDNIDDARDLIRRGARAKSAVVVGGGITALEIVEGLRARKCYVHYFMRKDRYWGDVLSDAESRIIEQGLLDGGVEVHHFAELASVSGSNGRVAGVQTVDGEQIPCNLVAVAIGVLPHKALGQEAGLECGRGILVDEYLRSSDADIFAAGDVAEVCDPVTGKRTVEVLWSSAVTKGRVAGLNMADDVRHVYRQAIALNVTRLAGYKTTIIGAVGTGTDSDLEGIARGDSDTWRERGAVTIFERQEGDAHLRLAMDDDRIVGAVIMGDQTLSFPLQTLITSRAHVPEVRERLQMPTGRITAAIADAWRVWSARNA